MVFGFLKPGRRERIRQRLRAQPFPAPWRRIVERNLPFFNRLSPEDQGELLGHTQVFLEEKYFEGCAGLSITDEIRVTIAAQACLLLLHRDTGYFPQLVTILVYPSGYTAEGERPIDGDIWEEGPDDRLGHTEDGFGALLLSWDDVRRGAEDAADGENLVLHEFAHQLDFEDPGTEGTPALASRSDYAEWRRIMDEELEELRAATEDGQETLLDPYGATDLSELFAVATETFFELPRAMKEHHPELYGAMQRYYDQDPVQFSSEPVFYD